MPIDGMGAEEKQSSSASEATVPPELASETPVAVGTEGQVENADFPPEEGTIKKKKKKRVGGIAFAVQVEEQVIQSNEEEMAMRREHWQAINEKASDPNTVYSNDNSLSASGNASPMRLTKDKENPSRAEETTNKAASSTLDHQELNSKLQELAIDQPPTSPRSADATIAGDSSPTKEDSPLPSALHSTKGDEDEPMAASPLAGSGSIVSGFPEVEAKQAQEGVSDEQKESPGVQAEDAHAQGTGDSVAETGIVLPECKEVQSASQQEQDDRLGKMEFLRTSHNLVESDEPPKKRDAASEPPSAGCPSLVTPSLDAYISDKDRDDLFETMARGLLEYIGCFPIARKVPIPPIKAENKDNGKSKEELERQARLKAKAASAKKRRGIDEETKESKKPPPPLPPKDEKTALDFQYAIKRWLERSWKAGVAFGNTYRIGQLMEADVQFLCKGSNPILESKLDTVWNGYGFEVKQVPLANVSEWDWRDLARRLRDQHMIGDKFFPSEEYNPQWGLDAMRVPTSAEDQAIHEQKPKGKRPASEEVKARASAHERALARESVYWTKEATCWEDSTDAGLSADFTASTQLINWDYNDDGSAPAYGRPTTMASYTKINTTDETRPPTSQSLSQFVEASKADWVNTRNKSRQTICSRGENVFRANTNGSNITSMPRSISEPLFRQPNKATGAVSRNFSDGKKRRALSDEQRQKQMEEEKEFRRFIKLHTGRTRVSQRKMEECREPFRLYKLQKKRIAAVGTYGIVLGDMEQEFEEMLEEAEDIEEEDDGYMSEAKRQQKALLDQLFPPQNPEEQENENAAQGADTMDLNFANKPMEKEKETPLPMPAAERLRVGSSIMTGVEQSFAKKRMVVGKTEVADMLQASAITNLDSQADPAIEMSFDEFLRRPMKTHLARDPGLVKSLRMYSSMVGDTGLQELEADRSRLSDLQNLVRPPTNRRATKLPELSVSLNGTLPHLGRPEQVRSKSSMDQRHSGDRSNLEGTGTYSVKNLLTGGIQRRDGLKSRGSHFSTTGFDLSRSPYAQKMPSRPETKSSKKRATMKQSGDWHSKFSKIGSQDIVANVLAHLPIK